MGAIGMSPNTGKYFPKEGERHPNLIEHERIVQLLIDSSYLEWGADEEGEYSLMISKKKPQLRSDLPKSISLSVEWGYELHSVSIGIKQWAEILAGHEKSIESEGWYEGTSFSVRWSFNSGEMHSLVVTYGDDGATGHEGDITDGYIHEEKS
jgi:hypothetical protein